jgi:hypothetical protein
MEGLTGDWAALRRLRAGVDDVAREGFGRVVRRTSEAVLDAVHEGHAQGRDPSGASWASTTDGRRALQGGFPASWRTAISGNVVTLATSHDGAGAHQRGKTITPKTARVLAFVIGGQKVFARKVKIPQRRMHPSGGTLETWAPRLRVAALDELAAVVGVAS